MSSFFNNAQTAVTKVISNLTPTQVSQVQGAQGLPVTGTIAGMSTGAKVAITIGITGAVVIGTYFLVKVLRKKKAA